MDRTLPRRLFAELLGSAFLAAVVIGSRNRGQQLSPGDVGLELLENAAATAAGLFTIIGMFSLTLVTISTKHRATGAHFFSEIIATLGLLLVIFSIARTKRGNAAPAAVGAYIGAAYFFTSSTSFANPAIDVGRMFSDTFAGIAPSSVPHLHRRAVARRRGRDRHDQNALPRRHTRGSRRRHSPSQRTAPEALGAFLGAGGFLGSYLGARLQSHLPERALRRLLGSIACVVAARYIRTATVPTHSTPPAHATAR